MTHHFEPLFYHPSECHNCGKDRASHDLARATQALHDAAVAYAVARARWLDTHGTQNVDATCTYKEAQATLLDAAEDYADAYLRKGK